MNSRTVGPSLIILTVIVQHIFRFTDHLHLGCSPMRNAWRRESAAAATSALKSDRALRSILGSGTLRGLISKTISLHGKRRIAAALSC